VAYLAVTSWSVATLFYQIAVAGDPLWIVVALVLLGLMAGVFWAIGRWAATYREPDRPVFRDGEILRLLSGVLALDPNNPGSYPETRVLI
jgi:hypothetical protein